MVFFRRLAITSLVTTLILIGIGGLVRATASGLGCGDDWPHCNGRLTPALATRAEIIEFSHRFVAMIVGFMILGLTISAFRHYRRVPRILLPTEAALGLVVVQALLGAVVVFQELKAAIVVVHMATAMSLLALEVWIVTAALVHEGRLRLRVDRALSTRALWVALSVLLLMAVGSYVSSFPDRPPEWPLVNGQLIPPLDNEVFLVHFVHRVVALVVGIGLLVFAVGVIRTKKEDHLAVRCAYVAIGTFFVETMIGATNVTTNLNPIVVTLHLLSGGVIWAALVTLVCVTSPIVAGVAARERVGRAVALEGRS
jgi:cytochrome c oxidase assembly protein subunit 15